MVGHTATTFWVVLISTLLVAALLGLMFYFDAQAYVVTLLQWLDGKGLWAFVIFMLINALVVVLLLPGIMITMGAGFMFGVAAGTACVVIATTVGAAVAFFIARSCFSDRITHYLVNHQKLKLLNDEFVGEGWRFILLIRMLPFFPFKLSNYFFGLTRFSAKDFLIGTFFGIIPITTFNVYLGSLVADIAQVGVGDAVRSPLAWAFYIFGFVITLIVVIYISRHTRKALDRYAKEQDKPESLPESLSDQEKIGDKTGDGV